LYRTAVSKIYFIGIRELIFFLLKIINAFPIFLVDCWIDPIPETDILDSLRYSAGSIPFCMKHVEAPVSKIACKVFSKTLPVLLSEESITERLRS